MCGRVGGTEGDPAMNPEVEPFLRMGGGVGGRTGLARGTRGPET